MANPGTDKARLIQLDLRDMAELFNPLDPSPLLKKDLDREAEEFILSWAQEYPMADRLTLRIHLEEWPGPDSIDLIQQAVHNFFNYRWNLNRLEFHRLMAQGRVSLLVGLGALTVCIALSRVVLAHLPGAGFGVLREGLTIVGWVAMWRPIQIYLHDWWPIRRRGRILAKLSRMPVEVVHSKP
jgi:hypothetical protein